MKMAPKKKVMKMAPMTKTAKGKQAMKPVKKSSSKGSMY
jgi:hypothetical protein